MGNEPGFFDFDDRLQRLSDPVINSKLMAGSLISRRSGPTWRKRLPIERGAWWPVALRSCDDAEGSGDPDR